MKLKGKLPIPSLTATLREPIGKAWRVVDIEGIRKRQPRGQRKCGACGGLGHQRNSFECPARPAA